MTPAWRTARAMARTNAPSGLPFMPAVLGRVRSKCVAAGDAGDDCRCQSSEAALQGAAVRRRLQARLQMYGRLLQCDWLDFRLWLSREVASEFASIKHF